MKPKPTIFLLFLLICGNMLFSKNVSEKVELSLNDSRLYFNSKMVMPYTPDYHTLGSLVGIDRIIKRANLTPYAELNRIIYYESKNNPEAQNPNSSAYGYCQMINTTEAWVARDIKKESGHVIDYENTEDQLQACIYLYENGDKYSEWKETRYLWDLDYNN